MTREKPNDIKHILISRTDNLGDVILTLPLVSAAKKMFPGSEITLLVKKEFRELLQGYKNINSLIFINDVKCISCGIKLLSKEKFDCVISVYPRFQLALIFFLSGIKYRIGTGYRWYSFLFNKKVYEHRKFAEKHESQYNLDLLNVFSPDADKSADYYFTYSPEEKISLDKKLSGNLNFSLNENYLILHPGSRGSAIDLPSDTHTEYLNGLLKANNSLKIVLTGTKGEMNICKNLIASVEAGQRNRIYNTCGILSLRELMVLIDSSKLFISNSTGPLHIAGALNKNIISFFPNSAPMNAKRWGPLSSNAVVINPTASSETKSNKADDMAEIRPQKILEEINKIIK